MGTETDRTAERAKQAFDASVERLDAATLSRLNQGRHAALDELRRTGWAGLRGGLLLPATGVAGAALVAAIVMRGPDDPAGTLDVVTTTDMELLLDEQSLEMLEDLEFYSWLEAEDLAANGNVG